MRRSPNLFELAFVALPAVLLAFGCSQGGGNLETQFEAKLKAIRQAGYPVTLAEDNAWYAEPPADENAATIYDQAFASLPAVDTNSPTFLADNQPVLDLLHQAATRPKCRYPIDLTLGANTLLPHLAKLKKSAQLLAQAAQRQSSERQMERAAQSLLDGLRLARSLEQEPISISRLVQIAADNIIQRELESILNQNTFSPGELKRLQEGCQEAERGLSLTRALAGERVSGIDFFLKPIPQQVKLLAEIGGTTRNMDLQSYRKSSAYREDFSFYLDRMEEAITASTRPFPDALEETNNWTAQVTETADKDHLISRMFLPALASLLDRAAEGTARLRLAQTALAVERYRLGHPSALPDSLTQLTPEFLDVALIDPFDGKPLRYVKSPTKGYVVYSVGSDRNDDGGKPKRAGGKGRTPFDLTFTVQR